MKIKYMKFIPKIYYKFFLFVVIFFIAYLVGCEKEDFLKKPEVKTINVDNFATSSIVVTGEILNPDDFKIKTYGFCWSESENPEISDNVIKLGIDTLKGIYSSLIDGLKSGSKYYIRAYAKNEAGIGYGEVINFTTKNGSIVISTSEVTEITDTSATCEGIISDDGGLEIIERGICWNKDGQPTIDDSTSISNEITNFYSCDLRNLNYGTIYYVKAYTKNEIGIYYGDEISFRTDTLPIVISSVIENISVNSATVGGNVTSDGGASVTERGVYYGTSSSPEATGTKLIIGSGTGTFTADLTGLSSSTTYYVRAYAKNSIGISYGNESNFNTTNSDSDLPTVTTSSVTEILDISATVGGNVISDGGSDILDRGIWIDTSTNPEISGVKISIGIGTGNFSKNMDNLTAGTIYYIKAYATNSSGTSYGEEISFTTLDKPSIQTITPSSVTVNSAESGGTIADDGGAEITSRGVCWNTSSNPTTSNFLTSNGSGTGSFISSLTNLNSNTTYYIRAYATNIIGTAYGNEESFTTDEGVTIPNVETSIITDITETSATVGGNVIDNGGANVTEKGIYYGTTSTPEISGTKIPIGSGEGIFSTTINGLNPGTIYWVKAYAINSEGYAYGEAMSFSNEIAIGLTYQGGIIFYIDDTGEHGLVCAPTDQSDNWAWCNSQDIKVIGAFGTAVGSGLQNTIEIVDNTAPGSWCAAQLCHNLELNGYTDWFLPSKDELSLMRSNLHVNGIGDFGNNNFWSSSEYDENNAWKHFFGSASGNYYSKTIGYHVRAVRAF